MERDEFEWLVARAVESLPQEFRAKLGNVDLVVQDWPTRSQQTKLGLKRGEMLLGLYEDVPQTKRTQYGMLSPDKITIFQKPIEAKCKNNNSIKKEIQRVVRHEIALHFGIGGDRLRQIEDKVMLIHNVKKSKTCVSSSLILDLFEEVCHAYYILEKS